MMSITLITTSLALATSPVPAASAPMRPSGPWTVQFADRMCAMGREFAGAEGPATLVIRAPLLGGDYAFTIASAGRVDSPAGLDKARLIGADGVRSGDMPSTSFTAKSKRISRFTLDGYAFKLRDAGSVLTVDMGKEGTLVFAVGGLPKALDKLEECMRGLRKNFGVDQALVDRIATPIAWNGVVGLFNSGDYPRGSMVRQESGSVGALFFVETDGRVRDCRIIEPSGHRELDYATCNVIRSRTRAKPALDATGAKLRVPSYARIRWHLPG